MVNGTFLCNWLYAYITQTDSSSVCLPLKQLNFKYRRAEYLFIYYITMIYGYILLTIFLLNLIYHLNLHYEYEVYSSV